MKALVALAVLLLCALPAHAEPAQLSVAGKQIALPAGDWIVAGRGAGSVAQGSVNGAYGAIRNLVLLRLTQDGAVDATAELNVNALAVTDGWGVASDCLRGDLELTVMRSRAGWDAACFFIGHLAPVADAPPAWQQARQLAAQRGWALPATTTTAGFRVANRRDVIDARFHFATGASDSDIAAWSAVMIGCLEAGLKNRLPEGFRLPSPQADAGVLEASSMTQRRQARLDSLLAAGVLSREQYAAQSALLRQQEASGRQAAVDPGSEEFYRLLSYQGLSVTSDALVTFVLTAQSVQAATVTLLQASLRTGRSYVTAWLWDLYGGSPVRPDVARVVDFAYGEAPRGATAASPR